MKPWPRVAQVDPSVLLLLASCTVAAGCDPYPRLDQANQSYGPVDPATFPPANLGDGGDRLKPGQGSFAEAPAFVGGEVLGYFLYTPPAVRAGGDALRVLDNGKPYSAIPTSVAYVFDGAGEDPFPQEYACKAPAKYKYDLRRDDFRLDQQGNVFTALPKATYNPGVAVSSTYVPVVEEVAVSSSGRACQGLKSEKQIKTAFPSAKPDPAKRRYLAWLVIDPGAAVYPFDAEPTHTGLGLQSWGWYNGYLLAYIDGGYIPTEEVEVTEAMVTKPVVRVVPQKLYIPRSVVITTDAKGMETKGPGAPGQGYDVLGAKRGEQGYSPICEITTYALPADTAAEDLPKDAATIEAMFMPMGTKRYVYCLQAKAR